MRATTTAIMSTSRQRLPRCVHQVSPSATGGGRAAPPSLVFSTPAQVSHLLSQQPHLRFALSAIAKPYVHETKGRHARSSFDPNPDSDGAKIGEVILTDRHGYDVLLDPGLNKGTGFPMHERERLGIRGLVPPKSFGDPQHALESGVKRVMDRFADFTSPIRKYVYLTNLADRNETLFYRILIDHIGEMAPIVYTPTVGQACMTFGTVFRRPRGMYFSAADKGCMAAMAFNWPADDVEIIVVTDGSRILGLGDLGANGMGIPIGKLALYSAAAGIHPSQTLPCLIDVGTNNTALLEDDHGYLGLQQRRLTGDDYDQVVDEFIRAVRERWPRVVIQFEDFSNENALKLLNRYRNEFCTFNDDIQGTGCVALAGLLTAMRAAGSKNSEHALSQQRILIAGAGSAGIGVANAIKECMLHAGLTQEEALQRFVFTDVKGSLGKGRKHVADEQVEYVRSDINDAMSIEETVAAFKPTIIIGLTGVHGLFTEKAITTMASYCETPIVFPLSNPTDHAECTAEQAYNWTKGKCIFASGSPFDPVEYEGKTLYPGQSNNFFTFPGIGLGAIIIQARTITDSMLYAAAQALANFVSDEQIAEGRIFPRASQLRDIAKHVALAVAKAGIAEHVEQIEVPTSEPMLEHMIERRMWDPSYGQLVRVPKI